MAMILLVVAMVLHQDWFVRLGSLAEPLGDIDDGMRLQPLCFSQKRGAPEGALLGDFYSLVTGKACLRNPLLFRW
jgi:hypothetical protein